MRIAGHIEHPTYKITILEMNHRLSLQIEDGDLMQTFRFKDGTINHVNDMLRIVDDVFLAKVNTTFLQMNATHKEALQTVMSTEEDFPEII